MEVLLQLLKRGCKIIFPSGFCIKGLPTCNYLDIYYDDPDCIRPGIFRPLTLDGLAMALKDADKFEVERESGKYTLFDDPAPV